MPWEVISAPGAVVESASRARHLFQYHVASGGRPAAEFSRDGLHGKDQVNYVGQLQDTPEWELKTILVTAKPAEVSFENCDVVEAE